jgi:RNA polymerase sigma factor (sigma-70 family)
MSEPVPVADLLQRFQAGDQRAAEELFARYAQRLTRLAEQHLSRKLAGRMDGEDVVQSVFRTFFRRSADGEFRIDSSAQLWQLLVKITLLKARAKARYHTAGKRDAGVEQAGGAEDWLPQAVAHDPGPEEAAVLVDQIESLLRGLPPLHAQVLERRLEGCHVTDIASQLGVSRVTVHRVLNLLQQRLETSAERAD